MRFRLSLVLGALLAFVGCGGSSSGGGGGSAGAGARAGTGGQTNSGGAAGGAVGGAAGGAAGHDAGAADGGGATTFAVGGTVTGLAGSGLTLQDGAGNQLSVTANGVFAFATKLAAGTSVTVTVGHQPSTPTQTCVVSGGTVADLTADVTDIAVTCTTATYTVGGTVAGLTGSGLVLQDNSGDDLAVSASGSFVFATPISSGKTYTVSVKTQPAAPVQTCQVSGGSGTVGAANVTSVSINCATNAYTVGGTVSGLAGTGLVLQNKSGDDLSLTGNGSFAFPTSALSGDTFAVTVKTQPSSPMQVCSISQGTGTVAASNITSVVIVCATDSYAVGGTVTGLSGSSLVLQDNLGDNLSVTAAGKFTFATPVADGSVYKVTVLTQPSSPSQTCTVTGGSGTIAAAAVSNVSVACTTNSFAVGGTVVGLSGSGLTLQNEGGDDLVVSANGTFQFATPLLSGAAFSVAITAQPSSPTQSCSVSGGTGTVGAAAVTSVTVNCATDQFTVSGAVTNLTGSGLTLSLNGGASTLVVGSSGSFSFPTTVPSGMTYAVSIASQPTGPSQTCSVTAGSGTIVSSNITSVAVDCTTDTHAIGGTVTGIVGMGLTLQDNGGDDLALTADGTFVFPTNVTSGQGYSVTVSANPSSPWQTCVVSNGSGGVTSSDITSVTVACTTNIYQVGGSISGLASAVTLNDGTDSLVLSSNGTFAFPTSVSSGGTYAVTVTSQPTNPTQTCTVTNGSGTVNGTVISGIIVSCATNSYAVGGMASGLLGSGLTLQDNNGDDLLVNADGVFTFATPVLSGGSYQVTIKTQPSGPTQTCTLGGATGSIGASAVSSVTVNCSTNSYIVGGTITGLTGGGLVIQNNNGGDLSISGSGSFAFAAPVPSGQPYAVTVKTSPTNPWQTCTVTGGSGTVTNANISAQISCTANPYPVAVAVTGLAGSGLVLQNNAGDNLAITGNSTFTFATPVRSGLTYAVTVLSQPTNLWQTCTVTAPAGTIAGAVVTLAVNCVSNPYTVGVNVSGLNGSGLVLKNNGGDNLAVGANGAYTFATSVRSGSAYAVTVGTSPSAPSQSCAITNGSGTIAGGPVNNINVVCTNIVVCGTSDENGTLSVACAAGQTISAISFASYGTPSGTCGSFTVNPACNATTSTPNVSAACLNHNSCTVPATNTQFGDPCVGTFKRLYVSVTCQ